MKLNVQGKEDGSESGETAGKGTSKQVRNGRFFGLAGGFVTYG